MFLQACFDIPFVGLEETTCAFFLFSSDSEESGSDLIDEA